MRIGIAAVLGTSGGPRSYARALIEALARVEADHEYLVLTDAPSAVPAHPRVRAVHVPRENRYAQPIWDHVRLGAAAAALRLDLFHHTKAALPLGLTIPSVVSVYDAAPFLHARTFSRLQALHHRGQIRDAARRADRVVTVSQEARVELARALGLDRGRIAVVEPGATTGAAHATPSAACASQHARLQSIHPAIRAPFVLALGTIQPRKDLSTVIRAFRRAKARFAIPHQLVIAGRSGWQDPALVQATGRDARDLVWTGEIDDDDVAVLLANAALAVNASLYEGFGLAVLEALAHGVPLVSTTVPALSRAAPDVCWRVPAGDVGGFACGIGALATDPVLRARLAARGREHAARFSWDEAARATLAVYDEVVTERTRARRGAIPEPRSRGARLAHAH